MKNLMGVLTVLSVLVLAGCSCVQTEPYSSDETNMAPAPAPAPQPAKTAMMAANQASQVYLAPCCGALKLDKELPATVTLKQAFDYTVTATNLTDQMLKDVVITEELADGMKYISSSPAGKLDGKTLTWTLDSMAPNASQTLAVKVQAEKDGWLATCCDATYKIPACAKTQVVHPTLQLTKTAPSQVTICETIPMKFTVSNSGTGVAADVAIRDQLPAGLTTMEGQDMINIPVGDLAPGKSVTQTVMVKASKPGTYENKAIATAKGLKAESSVTRTKVTQPVLAIEKIADDKEEYIGRRIRYTITVTNKGDAVAEKTIVTDSIPAGSQSIQLSTGGLQSGSQATWDLGSLAPKASQRVTISYLPATAGKISNTATAKAVCANAVSASTEVVIRGIPGLLLEVIDVSDPIEVGDNETYIITVTNQGSAVATNVTIASELEDAMEFVSAGGATQGNLTGNKVQFQPLASLSPKAKASWRVVVKAVKAGDIRFSTKLTADQIEREVFETESTHFYE